MQNLKGTEISDGCREGKIEEERFLEIHSLRMSTHSCSSMIAVDGDIVAQEKIAFSRFFVPLSGFSW
jgi:hypothetical protein